MKECPISAKDRIWCGNLVQGKLLIRGRWSKEVSYCVSGLTYLLGVMCPSQ